MRQNKNQQKPPQSKTFSSAAAAFNNFQNRLANSDAADNSGYHPAVRHKSGLISFAIEPPADTHGARSGYNANSAVKASAPPDLDNLRRDGVCCNGRF